MMPHWICNMVTCQHIAMVTVTNELTHWKRPWCWERLKAGGEGDDRGQDGWVASPTQRTWVWASSVRWWRTGKPGVLQSMGSQRVRHDWKTEKKKKKKRLVSSAYSFLAFWSFTLVWPVPKSGSWHHFSLKFFKFPWSVTTYFKFLREGIWPSLSFWTRPPGIPRWSYSK